jgi:hypothetical protein
MKTTLRQARKPRGGCPEEAWALGHTLIRKITQAGQYRKEALCMRGTIADVACMTRKSAYKLSPPPGAGLRPVAAGPHSRGEAARRFTAGWLTYTALSDPEGLPLQDGEQHGLTEGNVRRDAIRGVQGSLLFLLFNHGKPPALPGDSQSLTVPGVCRS